MAESARQRVLDECRQIEENAETRMEAAVEAILRRIVSDRGNS